EVTALRGRPIGGMPPAAGQGYFLVHNPASDQWEAKQLAGDVTGDFDDLEVSAIRGRPIGGMPPSAGQTLVVEDLGGGTLEWRSQDVLSIPLQSGGTFSQSMLDLTNNDRSAVNAFSGSDHGVIGNSDRFNGEIIINNIEDILDTDDFSAGILGEGVNFGSMQDPVGVWGRGVIPNLNSVPGFGFGGIFEGSYIGVIGVIQGTPNDAIAIYGKASDNSRAAVLGQANGADWAGDFLGDVRVTDDLTVLDQFSAGGKNFKIDHPLAPTEMYLYHSTVESPERKNIYDGVVTTNAEGYATVELPDYFEALNTDFRYQLTVIGSFAQAIVKEKVQGNRFVIQTAEGGVEVSWQVTGVRKDAFSEHYPLEVEVPKTGEERGTYLHPEAFGADTKSSVVQPPQRTPQQK
ncbi:MAG: hypothetical protein AAFY48_08620, partial [Bacteroidota bacterium]